MTPAVSITKVTKQHDIPSLFAQCGGGGYSIKWDIQRGSTWKGMDLDNFWFSRDVIKILKSRNYRKTRLFILHCLLDVLNAYFSLMAATVFKIDCFEFLNFTPHNIKMAARRLSHMVKKMPHPVIFNNLNSWGFARSAYVRMIRLPFIAEVNSRCFHRFPTAMLVPMQMGTNMAFPYCAL